MRFPKQDKSLINYYDWFALPAQLAIQMEIIVDPFRNYFLEDFPIIKQEIDKTTFEKDRLHSLKMLLKEVKTLTENYENNFT